MSGSTTAVPPITWGPGGIEVPSEPAVLQGVLTDMNVAFGGDLTIEDATGDPELRTPQGQWASSATAIIGDANDNMLAVQAGVDPAFSTGRWQDGIGRIYFLERDPALPTVVPCLVVGVPQTPIPAGTPAYDQAGNQYVAQSAFTIPASSQITADFVNVVTGPIPCPAGTLTKVGILIPGWNTINNPTDGILGQDVESPAQFEERRALSVAHNAVGSVPAVTGAVLDVADVLDAFVQDNPTGAAIVIDGVTVPAHSLYVCAAGGTNQDVAFAIWLKKAPGCGYATANTTVTVTDPTPIYQNPPTYPITFERPAVTEVYVQVTIKNSPTVPANATSLIQTAVMSAFAGDDGGTRARIGSTIFATRYVYGIQSLGAWAQIINIKVGTAAPPTVPAADDVTVGAAHIPSIVAGNITVVLA